MRRYRQLSFTPNLVAVLQSVKTPISSNTIVLRKYPQFGSTPNRVQTLPKEGPAGGTIINAGAAHLSWSGHSAVVSTGNTFAAGRAHLSWSGAHASGNQTIIPAGRAHLSLSGAAVQVNAGALDIWSKVTPAGGIWTKATD